MAGKTNGEDRGPGRPPRVMTLTDFAARNWHAFIAAQPHLALPPRGQARGVNPGLSSVVVDHYIGYRQLCELVDECGLHNVDAIHRRILEGDMEAVQSHAEPVVTETAS